MFQTVKNIHEALGIESTWLFVIGCALIFALVGGFIGWAVDAPYRRDRHKLVVRTESIKGLSELAKQGNQLIADNRQSLNADWPKAQIWAKSAEAYIRLHISESDAAYFSSASVTHQYSGSAIDRNFVDWIYTRIERLDEISRRQVENPS